MSHVKQSNVQNNLNLSENLQNSTKQTGKLAEDIAVKHFVKHHFRILDRNYWKKWGEIDIVAEKNKILHFIEVKSISLKGTNAVSQANNYQPEENMHFWKRKRLANTIKTYLAEKKVSCETEWQVDVAAIFLDFKTRRAKIRVTENIILL